MTWDRPVWNGSGIILDTDGRHKGEWDRIPVGFGSREFGNMGIPMGILSMDHTIPRGFNESISLSLHSNGNSMDGFHPHPIPIRSPEWISPLSNSHRPPMLMCSEKWNMGFSHCPEGVQILHPHHWDQLDEGA